MGRRVKNTVILVNPRLKFTYALSFEQLEQFLDNFLDIILVNERDDSKYHLRITSSTEGIILNHPITEHCFNTLSKYLNEL